MRHLVVGLIVGLLGCSGAGERVRSGTYPPSFEYVERRDIRSVMWHVADDVKEIDQLLRDESVPDRAAQVQKALRDMEEHLAGLAKGGQVTNHPELDAHLERLIRDVRGAREAVEAEPANYFLAGAITGSCLYCHR